MLELKGISLSYEKVCILSGINAEFKHGEVNVITGNSGCGKSSLIKLINGIVPYIDKAEVSGDIILEGISLQDKNIVDRSRHISSVFQNPKTQFYALDTTDEMAFALENRGVSKEEIFNKIMFYSGLLGTRNLMGRNIFRLSGGEKQMVAITAVSCMEQQVYLFDEPSSSLDIKAMENLKEAILKLKELDKIIIIAEHRLSYLRNIIDNLFIIKDGNMVKFESGGINDDICAEYGLRMLKKVKKEELSKESTSVADLFANESKNISAGYDKNLCNDTDVLYCRDFKYRYGDHEVFNFDIYFKKGVHFIIGSNGVGKTSFIRCLCGLSRGFKGKIYYGRHRVRRPPDIISLVMQDVNYQLFTESVWDEISIVSDDDVKKESILKDFGLSDKKDLHPQSLSGGEKQRLAIALCAASKKPVVILDEPTSGLCRNSMYKTADFINAMRDDGKTVIVISHDYEFIKYCRGNIVEFKGRETKAL